MATLDSQISQLMSNIKKVSIQKDREEKGKVEPKRKMPIKVDSFDDESGFTDMPLQTPEKGRARVLLADHSKGQNTEIKDYKLLSGLSSFKESSFEDTVPKTAMKKPIIEPEEEINSNDTRSPTKYIQLQNVLAANKRADLLQYSQS